MVVICAVVVVRISEERIEERWFVRMRIEERRD